MLCPSELRGRTSKINVFLAARNHLTGADETHERRRTEGSQVVVVHFVCETGLAALIRSRHRWEIHARGVREDEPLPRDLDPLLTMG